MRQEARSYRLYRQFVYREVGVEEWPRKSKRAANRRNVIIFDAVAKSKSSHSEDDPARTKDTELVVTVPVVVVLCATSATSAVKRCRWRGGWRGGWREREREREPVVGGENRLGDR
jgi:hypothetical protein